MVGIDKAYGDKKGNRGEVYLFNPLNFANIAREFGCFGVRVEQPADIAAAVKQALASGQATLGLQLWSVATSTTATGTNRRVEITSLEN